MRVNASPRVYRDYNLGVGLDWNPFVHALAAAVGTEGDHVSREFLKQELSKFFSAFVPKSVYDLLGLRRADAPRLEMALPWTAPYPWSKNGIVQDIRSMTQGLFNEAQDFGYYLSRKGGCSWCGPVSDQKLDLEVDRFISVYSSIRNDGFRESEAIQALALVGDDNMACLLPQSGAHRFAACATLGMREIPFEVTGVVMRSDSSNWPQVYSGLFTEAGALKLFDRIANGQPATLFKQKLFAEGSTMVRVAEREEVHGPMALKATCSSTLTPIKGPNVEASVEIKFQLRPANRRAIAVSRIGIVLTRRMQFACKHACSVANRFFRRALVLASKSAPKKPSHPVTGDVYYGDRARQYEAHRSSSDYWEAEDAFMSEAIPTLRGVSTVLDVACGTGRFLSLFAKHDLQATCIDSSQDMLAQGELEANREGWTSVRFVKGKADSLPFPDSGFDLVVCFRFLSWIVSADAAIDCLREISRTTKKYAIIELCINKDNSDQRLIYDETMWNKLTMQSTVALLEQCGLEVARHCELVDTPAHPGLTAFLLRKAT